MATKHNTINPPIGIDRLESHGFWDYTTPAAGGMEHYQLDDYLWLLDDMRAAGMNSLALVIKWTTTGYRSQLPFLDQHSKNPVTASDNELLYRVFDEAGRRGIDIWLAAVVSIFPAAAMKSPPTAIGYWNHLPRFKYGIYDLDSREVTDRAAQVLEEIARLFPKARGLVVEVEASGKALPHRIPLYNRWARANGRPAFDKLGLLEARVPPVGPWRDYTTHRRIELARRIEKTVRGAGYGGELMMLCETGWQPGVVTQEVNLGEFAAACAGAAKLPGAIEGRRQRAATVRERAASESELSARCRLRRPPSLTLGPRYQPSHPETPLGIHAPESFAAPAHAGWSVLSYETAYNKSRNRHGMMEMAVTEAKNAGLKIFYLPRGVMSWVSAQDRWPLPISLQQSWRMDLEDIVQYRPEGVWWFGSGGLKPGIHVDPADLRKVGYASGRAARKGLLREIVRFQQRSAGRRGARA